MPVDEAVSGYYERSDEAGRLGSDSVELLRTRELLAAWLPSAPAEVLDVGGGGGVYALWLAGLGYTVDLLDRIPKHVEQAADASRRAVRPLRATQVGDARALPHADASVDVVLLLGPLYHLVEPADRRRALEEAWRVLRPGGQVVAAAIGRWASTADGLMLGYLGQEPFPAMGPPMSLPVCTGIRLRTRAGSPPRTSTLPASWAQSWPRPASRLTGRWPSRDRGRSTLACWMARHCRRPRSPRSGDSSATRPCWAGRHTCW